jgi:regulator of sigma E protease
MLFQILVTIFSLVALATLHELGHFLLAKKFGVKIEEFGIGYPPRIFGKKIGQTIYSLNLIPFGAFVRIYGEEGGIESLQSFGGKPIWQRAMITLGGVISFWIIAAILLSIVFGIGAPTAISDTVDVPEARVQVTHVADKSPAQIAGIKSGDTIIEARSQRSEIKNINKIKELKDFIDDHEAEEIFLTIQRSKEVFEIKLIPRAAPPEGEGAIGVALVRIIIESFPPYLAPIKGTKACLDLTLDISLALFRTLKSLFWGTGIPAGVEVMGIVGIGSLLFQSIQLGVTYYLQFVAIISIYLAIFNILPIPAVDGGKLLFLGIEKLKGRPINPEIEKRINALFFAFLIFIMFLVTIKDIKQLF